MNESRLNRLENKLDETGEKVTRLLTLMEGIPGNITTAQKTANEALDLAKQLKASISTAWTVISAIPLVAGLIGMAAYWTSSESRQAEIHRQ